MLLFPQMCSVWFSQQWGFFLWAALRIAFSWFWLQLLLWLALPVWRWVLDFFEWSASCFWPWHFASVLAQCQCWFAQPFGKEERIQFSKRTLALQLVWNPEIHWHKNAFHSVLTNTYRGLNILGFILHAGNETSVVYMQGIQKQFWACLSLPFFLDSRAMVSTSWSVLKPSPESGVLASATLLWEPAVLFTFPSLMQVCSIMTFR